MAALPTVEHLLATCPAGQLDDLLRQAAELDLPEALTLLVDHMASLPEHQRSSAGVRGAFTILAGKGKWQQCKQLLALVPKGQWAWMQAECWAVASASDDTRLLEMLPEFGLDNAKVPLNHLVQHRAVGLFSHVLEHRQEQLPTLDHTNRECAGALLMAAHCGQEALQEYLARLRQTSQPASLVEDKLGRIINLAWCETLGKKDEVAKRTMGKLRMWGIRGPQWHDLFEGTSLGAELCLDPDIRNDLSERLLLETTDTIDAMEYSTLRALHLAGLPIDQWRNTDGEHIGHRLLREKTPVSVVMAWLVLELPQLLFVASLDGTLPVDVLMEPERTRARQMLESAQAHAQARALDVDTPLAGSCTPPFRL